MNYFPVKCNEENLSCKSNKNESKLFLYMHMPGLLLKSLNFITNSSIHYSSFGNLLRKIV